MKKYLAVFLFTLISSACFAQFWEDNDSQVSLLIKGGSAISYFQAKPGANTNLISNLFNPVGYLGVGADFKINDYLSIAPTLALAGKGGQTEEIITDYFATTIVQETYELHYLQASFSLVGHVPLGSGANIFAGAGPFYGRAVFGTSKINNGTETDSGATFGSNGDFKNTDYGATAIVGLQTWKGYSFAFNIDYGLANIHNSNTAYLNGSQLNTRSIYFSVGKSF